jgi:hypothetical protein
MKRHVAMVTVSAVLGMLLSSIVPVHAANPDDVLVSPLGSAFHALSRMSNEEQSNLTPLTDGELGSVTGMAGWGLRGLAANLGIIVQINVCAVCVDVRQTNFAAPRSSAR